MTRRGVTRAASALAVLVALAWGCLAGQPARAAAGEADPGRVPDPALMLDTADEGAAVRLTELGDGPYVVAPIFTRCRAVCTVVAKALKSAAVAGAAGAPDATGAPGDTPVVLVSFDPEDTQADMAGFRETFELPASWHLARIEREEGLRFFSALGFQWRTLSRRQFDHSGKVFVLDDDLRIAAVLGPEQLTAERLGAELAAAESGASLARRIGTHWIGFFGVGVILLGLVVAVTWDKMRARRRVARPV